MQFKPKYRMYISLLLKSALAILTLGFLYKELFMESAFMDSWYNIQAMPGKKAPWLLLVAALMFLNWGVETWKWKRLIEPLEHLPFYKAFLAILTGITVSMVTPNRIGEYAGRVLFLERGERVQAIFSTIVGSVSQIIVTLLLGAVGIFMLELDTWVIWSAFLFTTLCTVGLLFGYFRIGNLPGWLQKLKAPSSWIRVTGVLARYDFSDLWTTLSLSALRYGIFTLQYLLLWQALGIEVSVLTGIQAAGCIFLIQTIIPSFALVELGVRGSASVMVMSAVTAMSVEVVAASYLLWFINLVLPALLGLLAIWFARIFKA